MPARLRDVARVARGFGVSVVDGGTKHNWRALRDGCRPYTIPAHNGLHTEISDQYIRGLCRAFGIDWDTFLKELRG